MTFLVCLIIIIALWMTFGPFIRRWLQRRAMQKMADILSRGMGMPTEKERREARRKAERAQRSRGNTFWTRPAQKPPRYRKDDSRIIPSEYAEDVEFTEVVDYSQSATVASDGRCRTKAIIESQVSDVEFTEIKK